ncbi:AI-2E family transporter [Paracidobacterium acidisoli]|uniref:AI-2E family transporter n=1 Tax=Paracidobacterium acidisoli TaxID=2303751 RepID=A0A372IKB0_9BACT|nr:AI-2E family transporter [Paracidobacterium acidisoli]MBT9332734.1 AI-2E family transporter [Paracidobacterium acidisoli]
MPSKIIPSKPVFWSDLKAHSRTAGRALFAWSKAVLIEGLCVAVLWLAGLLLLGVPFAPLWAVIGGLMTLIPAWGGVIAVIFPVLAVAFSGHDEYRLGLVLGLYAVIVIVDQLVLQPWLFHRITRVPFWVSLLAPILLGILIPFWGVLLAPPLLAIVYAFRRPKKTPAPKGSVVL